LRALAVAPRAGVSSPCSVLGVAGPAMLHRNAWSRAIDPAPTQA